jgi:hypothetical protein
MKIHRHLAGGLGAVDDDHQLMAPSELADLAQRKNGARRPEDVRDGDDSRAGGDPVR